MKTNKPGTVTQQPLFGCASCYDDVSYPADHLHVYNGECWCENCWEYATHEIADGRDWSKLEPFKPALQVECERWKRGSEIRDEQNQDLHSFIMELNAECENLRKDAARYQSLLEAVLREIPHRKGNRGNAPGHAHSVPGIWDEDNGALAGKECAWCKVWNEAVSAMEGDQP